MEGARGAQSAPEQVDLKPRASCSSVCESKVDLKPGASDTRVCKSRVLEGSGNVHMSGIKSSCATAASVAQLKDHTQRISAFARHAAKPAASRAHCTSDSQGALSSSRVSLKRALQQQKRFPRSVTFPEKTIPCIRCSPEPSPRQAPRRLAALFCSSLCRLVGL